MLSTSTSFLHPLNRVLSNISFSNKMILQFTVYVNMKIGVDLSTWAPAGRGMGGGAFPPLEILKNEQE